MSALTQPARQPVVLLAVQAMTTLGPNAEQMERYAETELDIRADVRVRKKPTARGAQLVERHPMRILCHTRPSQFIII